MKSSAIMAGVSIIATAATVRSASGLSDGAACNPNARVANLEFRLRDLSGHTVDLSTYKGRVLLIDFWATWCGPCQVQIPAFVDLHRRYRSQGFEVIGFVVNDEMANAARFSQQYNIRYPLINATPRDDVQQAFGPLWAVPTSVIVSRDGRLCKQHIGFAPSEQIEKEVRALLAVGE